MEIFKTKKSYFKMIFIYIIIFIYNLPVMPQEGDDLYFIEMSKKYSLINFLKFRYTEWSPRLFPDAAAYILTKNYIFIWKLINPLFIILLSYSIVRIIKKSVVVKDIALTTLLLGYIYYCVLTSGFFWITGSYNYLWPISLGVFAMIPYADSVLRRDKVSKSSYVLSLFSAILTCIGNEQCTLCIVAFALLSHVYLFFKHQKQDKKLIVLTCVMIIFSTILFLAPGNFKRYNAEIINWYPNFKELSAVNLFHYGTVWMYNGIFNTNKCLLFLISSLVLGLIFKNDFKKSSLLEKLYLILYLLPIASFFVNQKIYALFFNFEPLKNNINLINLAPYIFWTIFTLVMIIIILNKVKNKFLIFLLFMASVCTLIMIFFSPTIYASMSRVFTVFCILMVIISTYIIKKFELDDNTLFWILITPIPLINLASLYFLWITNGYTVIL